MILLLLLLSFAPKSQPISYVTSDPTGACTVGVSMQYNTVNGKFWGCEAGTWALTSGGGSSVFSGSIATATTGITGTATDPIFSLADQSLKSPVRFEPLTLAANVTSVTFTNKTAGAKFSIVWQQDGSGNHTVTYGGSATNTCTIDTGAGIKTTQQFEVGSDGTTVNGVGCSSTGTASVFGGTVQALGGYKSADGTAGITGATCTAWKNGLCVSP